MARTKIIPPEGLLSDLEYTSVIVSYSNGIDSTGRFIGRLRIFLKKRYICFIAILGVSTQKTYHCFTRWRRLWELSPFSYQIPEAF